MPRLAANLSMMFNEVPFMARFAAAAEAGFTAVEYLFPYEFPAQAIGAELRRHHLEQALFNLPPGDWGAGERGLAALAGREAEFRDSVELALRYAEATGARRLHVMAGIASPRDADAQARYRQHVSYAAGRLQAHGLELLIEPINARDMPGYFLNDFDQAERLIRELDLPNLRLQYDIYHRQILHGDVARSLERLLPLVGHVQIASVPARHEPNTGELNDDFVLALLDRLNYAGYVGCEYRPQHGTHAGLQWMERWRRPGAAVA